MIINVFNISINKLNLMIDEIKNIKIKIAAVVNTVIFNH